MLRLVEIELNDVTFGVEATLRNETDAGDFRNDDTLFAYRLLTFNVRGLNCWVFQVSHPNIHLFRC